MRGFLLIERLGLALAFVGADEILERGLVASRWNFRRCDFTFEFADSIFHFLALDGIQTLAFGSVAAASGEAPLPFVGAKGSGLTSFSCWRMASFCFVFPPCLRQR